MAQFSGTGRLRLGGSDARLYDVECLNSGGLLVTSARNRVENCYLQTTITINSGSQGNIITNNRIAAGSSDAIILSSNNDGTIITNNQISTSSE